MVMLMPEAVQPAEEAPPRKIHLTLDGRRVSVQIRRRTRYRSERTDRDLEELHGWVATTDPEQHRWLSGFLREVGDRVHSAVDDAGDHAGRWRLSWNSYGETTGAHTYTLILRECDEISLESLVVQGLELHPYEYREETLDGRLLIHAKMVGSRDDVERLRDVMRSRDHLAVVRRGIQELPRLMRVGGAEWSDWDDGVKYRLVLMEQGLRESRHAELAGIETGNARAALAFYMNFAERLTELLVRKGLVDAAELESLRRDAAAEPSVMRRDFWRVAVDIDDI